MTPIRDESPVYENPALFDGCLRIYPTLRCNLSCPYCVNEQMGQVRKDHDLPPPERWAEAVNREGRHVVFTGGEPFLYPGFPELVNGVGRALKVRVYTNLSLDLENLLARIARPVHFYVSWHPLCRNRERFLDNLRVLAASKHFTFGAHAIEAEETKDLLADDLAWFRDQGMDIAVDPDQRDFMGSDPANAALVECCRRIYLIGPEGARFQCVSHLVRDMAAMENIFDGPLGPAEQTIRCADFGRCAPCDGLGETSMRLAGETVR